MNRKLSDSLTVELSFLISKELQSILKSFGDSFDGDRFDTIDYIAKRYNDAEIIPLLHPPPKLQENEKSVEERIKELRECYKKSDTNIAGEITAENVVRSRGRKKSQNGTLKERVFEALNTGSATYEEILKAGIVNIAENTFKTILSQWRKEKGIKVSRGRKKIT